MSNSFEKAALRYIERGWFVFPCLAGSKEPLVKWGEAATTNEFQVKEWAEVFPEANIGIATGPSGLVVLDVDVKNGSPGFASVRALLKDIPAIRDGFLAKTPSGGLHYYFKARDTIDIRNSAGSLAEGLDIRANGGFVLAPPSAYGDGKYVWERTYTDKPLAEIPMELVAKLHVDKWKPSLNVSEPILDGQRNDRLFRIGCKMRRQGFDRHAILAALGSINQQQCRPPVGDEELSTIADRCETYTPTYSLEESPEARENKATPAKGKRKLDIVSYDTIEKESLEWLWYGRIARSKFALMVGLPGKTKSYLTTYVAACVSRGIPLEDDQFNLAAGCTPKSVLMITYEDGQGDTIKPRLEKCGADMSRILTIPMESPSFTADDVESLETVLKEHLEIGLIVIDPIQSMMNGLDDNKETVVRAALNPLIRLCSKYKVAVLGVKHLNKDESKSIDNRVGGSQAYTGLARTILLAGHDNQKPFGIHGEVYAGVMVTKGNLAAPVSPLLYEINDRGIVWLGKDQSVMPDRLLPKPPERKKKDA